MQKIYWDTSGASHLRHRRKNARTNPETYSWKINILTRIRSMLLSMQLANLQFLTL